MQRSGHFHLCTAAAIRVAYPTGFYAIVVHFQLRPDPLAH
jgi:hypothetical protein